MLIILCIPALVLLVAWLGVRFLDSLRRTAQQDLPCYGSLGQVGLAIRMYCADYDGRFPWARNWCDAVGPQYVKNLDCFRCPALPQARSGYAYNAALSGFDERDLKPSANLAMAFDGTGGWNASGGPERFDPRHRGDGLFVYADVRREWKKAKDLPTLTWKP